MRDVIQTTLQREGYDVTLVQTAEEVLDQANQFSLIVLDSMECGSSYEVARELCKQEPHTPLLFLTANSRMDVRLKSQDHTMEILFMPFGLKDLSDAIRKLLQKETETDAPR